MSAIVMRAEVTAADRLGMTLCLAIIVHAMLVLGISFSPEPLPEPMFSAMEVILVNRRSEQTPEDTKILAQNNLTGGGETERFERPSAPLTAPLPALDPAVAAAPAPPVDAQLPQQPDSDDAPVETVVDKPQHGDADSAAEVPTQFAVDDRPDDPPVTEIQSKANAAAEITEQPEPRKPIPAIAERPLPSAAELITSSFALASLNAELQQRLDSRAKRPRRKFISASTREYRYAAYMEAWRAKVERVGNLNYPDEARRRSLSGELLLDVALAPNGSVLEVTVRKSSGHAILDDAAVRIVELAAPFAPFPDDIAREVDILHVTRTWQFLNSSGFASR